MLLFEQQEGIRSVEGPSKQCREFSPLFGTGLI